MNKSFHWFNLFGAVVLSLLVLSGSGWLAQARNQGYHAWAFQPVSSAVPANLPSPSVVEIGEKGELVVEYITASVKTYGLVFNGLETPLLAVGQSAPGGGTFSDCSCLKAYVVSPSLVYLTTQVNTGGSDEERSFRWDNNTLELLAVPTGARYDPTRNDAHGKFLAFRATDTNHTEYWITDGFNASASILLTNRNNSSGFTVDSHSQQVVGITMDGDFLVYEDINSGSIDCARSPMLGSGPSALNAVTTQTRIFWMGARSDTLASGNSVYSGCVHNGKTVKHPVLNSAGDVISYETTIAGANGVYTSIFTQLWLIPADGSPTTLVAQGELISNVGPYFYPEPIGLTIERQPIFRADTDSQQTNRRLFNGPNPAMDEFDGNFEAGFGQNGDPLDLFILSETGHALVYAKLADGSFNYALGSTAAAAPEWSNANGGAWDNAANWMPQLVPAANDETLFNLDAAYAVNFGNRDVGRVRVENGFVTFNGAELRLLGPLSVSGDAIFELASGKLDTGELVIGALPPVNPAVPSLAEVWLNQGTTLAGATVIKVGDAAPGRLAVNGAQVDGGPLLIGNAYPGSVTLSGSQTQWFLTGATAVGYKDTGSLDIESGAYLRSEGEVVIGRGEALKNLAAIVEVSNRNAPPPALGFGNWLILDTLTLGDFLPGELYISDSGQVILGFLNDEILQAGLRAHPEPGFDAILSVDGSGDTAATHAMLSVSGNVLLGMASGASVNVEINNGGIFDVSASDLYLGFAPGSEAGMTVAGINSHNTPARLQVTRPAPLDFSRGLCAIGESGAGRLLIHSGGQVECGTIRIGGQPGASGFVMVDGANGGSSLTTEGGLCIGGDLTGLCGGAESGSQGTLELKNSASVSAGRGTLVGPGGKITGSGDLAAGVLGLNVEAGGIVDPGVTVLTSTVLGPALASAAGIQTGVLQINGAMTLTNSAQVKLDILGLADFDQLVVSGTLQINGGTLILAFGNDYAPRQNDTFRLLLTGSVAGDFSAVQITGLQPGFQYDLDFSGGQIQLTALNNGIPINRPTYFVFMPLLAKGE